MSALREYRPPLLIHLVALAVLALLFVRGLQLARQKQQLLLPTTAVADLVAGERVELPAEGGPRYLLLSELPAGEQRWALYEILPARSILRWLSPWPAEASRLLVPLGGLGSGEYVLVRAGEGAEAAPRELDRPPEELSVVARFGLNAP